jgi:RNA 2',3'-cyclic 3'-phosphodiesterase
MPRLFTGLEIPPDLAFALSLKKGGLAGARWIDRENYHITLRYIGDIDHRTANEVLFALDRFSAMPAFSIRLTHLGAFGSKLPRTLYAGIEINDHLRRLQSAQERALQMLGLPPESRKFTPHVTLARLRGTYAAEMARFMAETIPFAPLEFTIGRFVLFSSRESVGGGPYIVEHAYPLAA